ncbi:MAG: hypothetical protein HS126_07075 [Anaerolineales bacterium]|nr:hypothetical protein [Anaerolineales bacterium]
MATSLELAITAIRSGRKEEGRQLLNLLIQQNPNNEMAWLWMSSVVNADEQRARCLYHVLAINPDNELARRGLQILGIVVSDSRPVKVPRDSQPIPVQRPQPETATPWPVPPAAPTLSPVETQPLPQAPQPAAQTEPAAPNQNTSPEERRPFRLDPKTITQELPFVPIREPFAEPARRAPSAFIPRIEGEQPAPAETAQPLPNGAPPQPAESVPSLALVPVPKIETPLPDFPAVPNAAQPASPSPTPPPTDTGPLSNAAPAQPQPAPAATPPQQPFAAGVPLNETRPSQPIWVTHSNVTMSMPTPPNQPPYSAPGVNSNVTMGMPTQFLQPQNPMQAGAPIHSNATMGMPMPPQNGQMPYMAEAAPMTPGMVYASAPFPVPFPQNQVYHSSSTMAMPTMTEAEARARLLAAQAQAMPGVVDPFAALRAAANPPDLGAVRASKKSSKKAAKVEDGEEEVNLLAVIVFGSLSVTALGGLGMLILLWITSV